MLGRIVELHFSFKKPVLCSVVFVVVYNYFCQHFAAICSDESGFRPAPEFKLLTLKMNFQIICSDMRKYVPFMNIWNDFKGLETLQPIFKLLVGELQSSMNLCFQQVPKMKLKSKDIVNGLKNIWNVLRN